MDKVIGIIKKIERNGDGVLIATIDGLKSWDLKDKTPLIIDWPVSSDEKVGDRKDILRSELDLSGR